MNSAVILSGANDAATNHFGSASSNVSHEDLLSLATHDYLTGLLNRFAFIMNVDGVIPRLTNCAFVFLDINKFKLVNDISGHEAGDEMLRLAAKVLVNTLPSTAIISRWSGDEFCFLLPDVAPSKVKIVISNLIYATQNVTLATQQKLHNLQFSIGVVFPDLNKKIEFNQLMSNADFAMYKAKSEEVGVVYFDPEADVGSKFNFTNMSFNDIKKNNDLVLDYQVIVGEDKTPVAYEALLRFVINENRFLPSNFICFCETTGSILDLDLWVLNEVINKIASTDNNVLFHVNMSAKSLADQPNMKKVIALIEAMPSPERLVIEITETQLLKLSVSLIESINKLAELKVKVAIDDFGSGYSSFKILLSLPIAYVKVDGSFTLKMKHDQRVRSCLQALSGMAKNGFNFQLISEFIEDNDSWELCKELGIKMGQGYLFGKPGVIQDVF